MKRVPSVDKCSAHSAVLSLPAGARLRRRIATTSRAACERAASWGSYLTNASAPVRLTSTVATVTRQLSRHSLQVLNAVTLTQAVSPSDANLTVDLDWRPALSMAQEIVCWSCAAIACCVVYIFTAPAAVSIPYGTCIALLFGLLLYTLRSSLMEEMYKARERIEADLGDPDSRFRHIDNLSVHVKVKASTALPPPAPSAAAARLAPPPHGSADAPPVTAVHCYHGFGSNTWSWSLVQPQLAERLQALVTAHDMPGFGLTQRPTDLSGYYLAFNGRLGRLAMDYELTVRGLLSQAEAVKSGEAGYPHTSVHAAQTLDTAPAAAAAGGGGGEVAAMQAVEKESGGSASEAAAAAVDQGLESPIQAAAAAAAEGSLAGVVKGAAAAVKDAATTSSSSSSSAEGAAGAPQAGKQQPQQLRVKRVLMGHSLGGACAALEYIFNPTEYAAVVLVDPAIIAGLGFSTTSDNGDLVQPTLQKLQDGTEFTRSLASGEYEQPEAAAAAAHMEAAAAAVADTSDDSHHSSSSSADLDALAAAQGGKGDGIELTRSRSATTSRSSSSSVNVLAAAAAAGDVAFYATRGDAAQFTALLNPSQPKALLSTLMSRVLGLAQTAIMLSTVLVISALRPAIVLLLRTLVRSRQFWANTLKQAYYDQSKVTPAAVDAYRMPQLVRGWEVGMVQFLLARLGAGGSSSTTTAAAALGAAPMGGLEDKGLATRFAAAVAAHGTPVLIVHGAGDKLVPASNSFKLAKLTRGCRLAVVKKAGHCPQEEEPELFSDIVAGFLARHVQV